MSDDVRKCKECGEDIDHMGERAKFCSGKCRLRFHRKKKDEESTWCGTCGHSVYNMFGCNCNDEE